MALNRVALAAALLEYDNENPASGLGYRKAQESAILVGARQAAAAAHVPAASGVNGRNRQRHSAIIEDRGSTYGYIPGKGPSSETEYAAQGEPEEAQEELDMAEVDLTSWGLPETLLPREPLRISTADNALRSRQSLDAAHSPASTSGVKPAVTSPENRKHRKGRTVSFHDYSTIVKAQDEDEEAVEELRQHEEPDPTDRPRSSMSIMNRGRPTSPFNAPLASPTSASATFSPMESLPLPLHVPLPPSPGPAQPGSIARPSSHAAYAEEAYDDQPNPFVLPAPAGPRVSRFDPKISTPPGPVGPDTGTRGTRTMDRPASYASGYFPPNAEPHHGFIPPPTAAPITRLRPRTLIMPMPLHGVLDPTQSQPSRWEQEGFTHGAKPMPPGALTRPDSFVGRLDAALPDRKTFTPSQQLFRVTLAGVDGKRDSQVSRYGYEAGFIDIPPSAERDGEIAVQQYGGRMAEDEEDSEYDDEEREPGEQDWRPETRYVRGPSLMDRLEARKAELKSKNRQFRGDNRPAMMSRNHTGPLVDLDASYNPTTGQTSPRPSSSPLLQLQDEDGRPLERPVSQGTNTKPGMPSRGKSVFGVDTVWERELKKLESQRESERALAAHMEEERRSKGLKKGKNAKGKARANQEQDAASPVPLHPHTETMLSQGREDTNVPPSLSLGDLSAALNAPVNPEAGTVPHKNVSVNDWAAGSDEEDGVAQPRRRKRRTIKPVPAAGTQDDSGSESDNVPLAQAFGVNRKKSVDEGESSEDEPLSNLKKKVSSRTLDVSDEDDIPLALRRAKKMTVPPATAPAVDVDEDDLPLAQRRLRAQQTGVTDSGVQHQQRMAMAMAQQQQHQHQHQSMMMNSMSTYGGAPMMGMGFPTPSPMPMGMSAPFGMVPGAPGWGGYNNAAAYPLAQAPPLDPKIDRWRREVEAREGSVISVPPSIITSASRS